MHSALRGETTVSTSIVIIVTPVLSSHSKIDKTKILMTNGSLMEVKGIAECSKGSILQFFKFDLH